MKKILLMALTSVLLLGCSVQPNDSVGITNALTNAHSNGYFFYFNKNYVVSDNATHIVISIPKTDKGLWIKYSGL